MLDDLGLHVDDIIGTIKNGTSEPLDGYTTFLIWLFKFAIILAIIALIVWIIDAIIQLSRSARFDKQYHVTVPGSIRLRRSKQYNRIGSFAIGYPTWTVAKKDGTRDLRTNNMHIDHNRTVICVGRWELLGKDPFDAYALVLELRAAGTTVGYCREEQMKRRAVLNRVNTRRSADSADGIIQQFRNNPTDFEPFCADLFQHLGWQAEPTPPVRDGGFDLRMRDPQGRTYIAECKCYDRGHHVGRPTVQKLQGANDVERAQRAMLITTSSFSADAIEYAEQVGIELINGTRLVNLCQQAFGSPANIYVPEAAFTLTREDIMWYKY